MLPANSGVCSTDTVENSHSTMAGARKDDSKQICSGTWLGDCRLADSQTISSALQDLDRQSIKSLQRPLANGASLEKPACRLVEDGHHEYAAPGVVVIREEDGCKLCGATVPQREITVDLGRIPCGGPECTLYAASIGSNPEAPHSPTSLCSSSSVFSGSSSEKDRLSLETHDVDLEKGLGLGPTVCTSMGRKFNSSHDIGDESDIRRVDGNILQEKDPSSNASSLDLPVEEGLPELSQPIIPQPPIVPISAPQRPALVSSSKTAAARSARQRDNRVVSFAIPVDDWRPSPHRPSMSGGRSMSSITTSSQTVDYEYRTGGTVKKSYPWIILFYLTILNPLLCFGNAIYAVGVITMLAIKYPFHILYMNILPPPLPHSPAPPPQENISPNNSTSSSSDSSQAPPTPTTLNDPPRLLRPAPFPSYIHTNTNPDTSSIISTSTISTLSRASYFTHPIRTHLSSPHFLHLRIIYQTTRPPPDPEEWDARRLVVVHLLSPLMSVVPCGVAAWGAALMWLYSGMLGDRPEVGPGYPGGGAGGWAGGRGEEEFYALRWVRKRWERWLLWALR